MFSSVVCSSFNSVAPVTCDKSSVLTFVRVSSLVTISERLSTLPVSEISVLLPKVFAISSSVIFDSTSADTCVESEVPGLVVSEVPGVAGSSEAPGVLAGLAGFADSITFHTAINILSPVLPAAISVILSPLQVQPTKS